MPGGFWLPGFSNIADQGTAAASSTGTTLTASGSINTKGSYAQLVASTPSDAIGVLVSFGNANDNAETFAIDIALGASGSEIVVLPNLMFSCARNSDYRTYFFPLSVPKGTRIAARCQSSVASKTITCQVTLLDGNFDVAAMCNWQAFGFSAAATTGTSVDPGATGNTKGSWVQLSSSLPNDIGAIIVALDGGIASSTAAVWLVDIGVGAAASEKVIVPNIPVGNISGAGMLYPSVSQLIGVRIPSGSRLAARAQANTNTVTVRNINVTVYGASL